VRIHFLAAILGIGVWSSATAPVYAQAPERRQSSALFGASDPRLAGEPRDGGLTAAGSVFGAFDDSLFLARGIGSGLEPQPPGSYAGFVGGLLYDRPGDQSLRASLSSAGHYFPAGNRLTLGRQAADLLSSTVISPWRTARLRSTGAARYSRHGAPFEGAGFPVGGYPLDLFDGYDAVHVRRAASLRGGIQLEQDWGPRRSLAVLTAVHTSGIEGGARSSGYELGGTITHRLAQYRTVRAGYTRHEVGHGGTNYVVHHLNTGADYGRPLSASRRAFVTFGGGTTILESQGHTNLRAIGDAGLRYELGRTWNSSARYYRGLIFVPEIADPLLADGLVGDFSGLLSRRLELFGSGSLLRGTSGLSGNETPYNIYLARTQLRYALSRVAAVYGEYLRFHYRFAESVGLGAGLPSSFDRQSFRVGVTVMTQLLH
jgi:hypothetical protein